MFQEPELDLQTELYDLLFTDTDCTAINSPYIWRAYRRDSSYNKIPCPSCNDDTNGYIEGEKTCPYCFGKGYLYDDIIIKGYVSKQQLKSAFNNLDMVTKAGREDTSKYILYTDSTVQLRSEDRLMFPEMDNDGRIKIPLKIIETTICLYSRALKASQHNSDFHIALLGG